MSYDLHGATGGVQAGYNWQLNPGWMLGFETDFNVSGIKGAGINPVFKLAFQDSEFRGSRALDWFGTARGRIGFLPTPDLVIYGTGGFAYGQVNEAIALDSSAMSVAWASPPPYGYK
jgi:outer membrane immunogenic protein